MVLAAFALLTALTAGAMFALPDGLARAQDGGPIKFPENGTGAVVTFAATDPEGKAVTWSVAAAGTDFSGVAGIEGADAADADHFKVDAKTGVLTFMAEKGPDFEMPRGVAISGSNTNEYKVVVAASDGAATAYHKVTVSVQNLDEAATTTIDLSTLQPRSGNDITVVYADGVGNPFLDTTGADNTAIVDPDGSKGDTTVTTIPAGDVAWQWSKSASRTGTFTDIDGATTVTYTPDSGDVNTYLRLTATYEDGQGEDKTLTATSAYRVLSSRTGNTAPQFQDDFDATETGDQEPAAMLDDGATAGANVGGPITASDAQSDRLTYSFDTTSPAADADVFQIDRATGQVTVGLGKTVSPAGDTSEPASVTKQATFTVVIKATDSHGASDTATLTITMKEADEAPVFTMGKTSHEFAENTAVATAVYTFAAYDPEAAAVTYELSGADAGKFALGSSSGELTFSASPNFEAPGDAGGNNVYDLTVKASDASVPAKSTSINVTVTVTNVDEAGSVSLSAAQPRIGVQITASTPVDPDGGVTAVTWQWQRSDAAAEDGTWADIKDATAAGYTPVAADDTKYIRAKASYTDAHGSGKTAFGTPTAANVMVVKARNLAPAFTDEDTDTPGIQIMPREVPENAGATVDGSPVPLTVGAEVVATDAADADTDAAADIFYILGGADARYFELADPNSDTGAQINVKAGTKLDYETRKTYTVTLTARDPEGLSSSVTVTINVTAVDEAPAITGPDSRMHPENGTGAVVTFAATDPEGKAVTWSVAAAGTDFSGVAGIEGADAADADHFKVDAKTGVLTFMAEKGPDFEMPRGVAISGSNTNEYKVVVAASDGAATAYHKVTVSVQNLDEAATTTIDLSTLQPRSGNDITVVYADGVGNPFLDTTGADNTAIVDPDGSKGDTTVTTIPAGDVAWQWSKSASRTGTFTDIDGATTVTYTPDSGDVNTYLRLTATYEDGQGEDKTLTATSAYRVLSSRTGNTAPQFQDDFDATETGDQEPAAMLDDGATAGANVGGPITASDAQSDRLTYSFDTTSPAADADVFQIDRATGQVTVGLGKTVSPAGDTSEPASVTKQATFTVVIKATDSHGASDTATLTITMKEADEAPVFTMGKTSHEFAENTAVATAVYTFAAYDPEAAAVTYELSGADAGKFALGSSSGELTFSASPNFEAPGDAGGNNVYDLTVKASDASVPAKSTSINVTVTVTNVDEAGSVSLSAAQPRIGVQITASTPVDPDGGVTAVTWQWQRSDAAAEDGTWADIKDATAAGYTPVAADDTKYIRAKASYTDAHGSGKTAFGTPTAANVMVVKARNLAPAFTDEDTDTPGIQIMPREVPENAGATVDGSPVPLTVGAEVVATDAADADTDAAADIFYILGGADARYFELADPNSDTGAQINVKAGTKLDYETRKTYTVTLTARDPEGLSSSVTVTINVTDVNEAPAITVSERADDVNAAPELSGMATVSYPENGTHDVATYTATDPEGETPIWGLSGADRDDFTITGGVLAFAASPDFENPADADMDNVYEVTVTASDSFGLSDSIDVMVTVTDTNENRAPAFPAGETGLRTVPELTAANTDIGAPVQADDPDRDALTYTLSGTDAASFGIVAATGQLQTSAALDYESKDMYSVTVTATDPDGLSDSVAVTITVTDVDEDPTITERAVTALDYAENGTGSVATYTATDPQGGAISWSLSGDDGGLFTITGGVLSFRASPDYEVPADTNRDNAYEVTVTATDPDGLTDSVDVTVTVTDVDETTGGQTLVERYDADNSGTIELSEVITAIDDYLFGTGPNVPSLADVITLIDLYLFG